MVAIVIIAIIICVVINISSKNRKKREEAERLARLKQQKEEAERQARLRQGREALERKRKEEESKRIDELNNETITVVYESTDENNKPKAIVKRSNGTYASVERPNERFEISEKIRIAKEKINTWNWYDETIYQRELKAWKQAELARQQIVEKREREEAEKQVRLKQQEEEENLQAKIQLEQLLIRKQNWQSFQQVLQQNNIIKLYHFTDRANITSIRKYGGLYSWDYCDKNGITIPNQGGDSLSRDLDRRYLLQDYVRVSFALNHPMRFIAVNDGRIPNPVILEISVEACYFQETRFANMNATKTGHKQGANLENLQSVHFNTVKQVNHFDLEETEKPYFQAEILVKTWIPIRYITNINNF